MSPLCRNIAVLGWLAGIQGSNTGKKNCAQQMANMKNSKTKSGGDATIELMIKRIKHLELVEKTLNDKLEALEARENKLEEKIDMLIQKVKHTVKVDKNHDKLD
jgi:hypothetical protein